MTRPTIIAGNWKLNPPLERGQELLRAIRKGLREGRSLPPGVIVAVFPPLPYLGLFSESPVDGVVLGSQDVSRESWGAYTGEVGAPLLRSLGVEYVLVGHSERRHLFGETDSVASDKVRAVAAAGMCPILCVGETEAERDRGETFEVVERQLQSGLEQLPAEADVVMAYEPVWAIGTGRTATPKMAAEVHRFIRGALARRRKREQEISIIYGGSVKPDNAEGLLADPDIDGALIGGASLDAESFLAILDFALKANRVQRSASGRME